MKSSVLVLFTCQLLMCGCVDFSPFISKSNLGNLELNIAAPEGLDAHAARVYVDDIFIGNVSDRMPILHVRNGKHLVKVELEGAATYTEALTILGDPNHQVLNVTLKRNTGV